MKPLTTLLDAESLWAWGRISLAWVAYYLGALFQHGVGILAAIFTFLQILVLLRREFGLFRKLPKIPVDSDK